MFLRRRIERARSLSSRILHGLVARFCRAARRCSRRSYRMCLFLLRTGMDGWLGDLRTTRVATVATGDATQSSAPPHREQSKWLPFWRARARKNASETFNMKKITLEILYTHIKMGIHIHKYLFFPALSLNECSVFGMKSPPPRGSAPLHKSTNTRASHSVPSHQGAFGETSWS